MTYLQKSNKPKRGRFGRVVLASFAVLLAIQIFAPSFIGGVFSAIFYPVWQADNTLSRNTRIFFGFLSSRSELIERNRALEEKLSQTETRAILIQKLERENEELKKLLGREESGDFILGAVLAKPPQSAYDTLIADLGESRGVRGGDRVFGAEGVALGYVDEVYGKSSRVRLYSAPEEKTAVVVDRTDMTVEALGSGGGDFEIKVPRDADIQVEDVLVASGIDRPIVGVVVLVESDPKESFKKVLARVPINISEMEWVMIKRTE